MTLNPPRAATTSDTIAHSTPRQKGATGWTLKSRKIIPGSVMGSTQQKTKNGSGFPSSNDDTDAVQCVAPEIQEPSIDQPTVGLLTSLWCERGVSKQGLQMFGKEAVPNVCQKTDLSPISFSNAICRVHWGRGHRILGRAERPAKGECLCTPCMCWRAHRSGSRRRFCLLWTWRHTNYL
jgi:hypothetical protein